MSNDNALAAKCRSIHNCGRVPGGVWYEHHVISGNHRMGEFQGAILNCQLDRLSEQNKLRNENGRYLDKGFRKFPALHRSGDSFATLSSQHLYLFRFDESVFGFGRAKFLEAPLGRGNPSGAGICFAALSPAIVCEQSIRAVRGGDESRLCESAAAGLRKDFGKRRGVVLSNGAVWEVVRIWMMW